MQLAGANLADSLRGNVLSLKPARQHGDYRRNKL